MFHFVGLHLYSLQISWLTMASGPGTNKTAAPATAVSPQLPTRWRVIHGPQTNQGKSDSCQVAKHLFPFHATSESRGKGHGFLFPHQGQAKTFLFVGAFFP